MAAVVVAAAVNPKRIEGEFEGPDAGRLSYANWWRR